MIDRDKLQKAFNASVLANTYAVGVHTVRITEIHERGFTAVYVGQNPLRNLTTYLDVAAFQYIHIASVDEE